MNKNESVAAFPGKTYSGLPNEGMDLRDYFAAKAVQGSLACQSTEAGFWGDYKKLAEDSYQIADAMLKARTK